MKLSVYGAYLAVLVPAFFVYLYAESMLRQGAISNIDAKKLNIETVVAELPGSVRDAVSYRIHYGQLQDALRTARTDANRALALSNLADFVNKPEQRVEFFQQVLLKYPKLPEAARAYAFFLNRKVPPLQITVPQFQRYVALFPQLDQYYIWTIGLARIREDKATDLEQFNFLQPLLKIKPQYRDYSGLYRQLSDLAARLGLKNEYRTASALEDTCLDLPMMETLLAKELEKKMAADKKNAKAKVPAAATDGKTGTTSKTAQK